MTESSRSTHAPLSSALELARRALADEPAGILTDFDGTLSPIVEDPSLARLVDGADGALAALAKGLAVVAVVTGRAAADARRMIGVRGVLIAGNHGTEWLAPGAEEPVASPGAAAVRGRLDTVLAPLPATDGVTVEHKGISATVHYRNARDPDAARAVILDAIGDVTAHGLELRHGRMSVELRAPELGDKGSAVRTIIERFGLRGALVMGDDVTDLDMFRAVAAPRRDGHLRGVIVAVGGADGEVPAEIAAAADVLLADPHVAAAFLGSLSGTMGG